MSSSLGRYEKQQEEKHLVNEKFVEGTFGERKIDDRYLIIKIRATDDGRGIAQYENLFESGFLNENTCIFGDEDNNTFIVFEGDKNIDLKGINRKLTEDVSIIGELSFNTKDLFFHKKFKPNVIPSYIKSKLLEMIVETDEIHIDNLCSRFDDLNIDKEFFSDFRREKMYVYKEIKRRPNWRKQYERFITTKLVNICKSCGKHSVKGCCDKYSGRNRIKVKMIVDWKIPSDQY
jgi:hypothetical protein